MRNYRNDPTANAAIGAVDRQLKRMRKEAEQLGRLRRAGKLTHEEEMKARARFRGIFKHLLDEQLYF